MKEWHYRLICAIGILLLGLGFIWLSDWIGGFLWASSYPRMFGLLGMLTVVFVTWFLFRLCCIIYWIATGNSFTREVMGIW